MDYTAQIEELKNQLKALGFDEDKLNQLMDLAVQEAIDSALLDLQDKDEETLNQLMLSLENDPTNTQEALDKVNKVFSTVYGEQAESKKQELVYNYLKATIDQTQQAKDMLQKYQAGDPSTVAFVKSQEGNPDVQKVIDEMQK